MARLARALVADALTQAPSLDDNTYCMAHKPYVHDTLINQIRELRTG